MITDPAAYFNRPDLLREVMLQVIKDFRMVGMEIKISENSATAFTELFSQLFQQVEKLQKEHVADFYNLMYRIDISEHQIKKAFESAKDKSFSEIVTDLILKRELQKVIIRRNFSSKD